jgi:hypothetical protein
VIEMLVALQILNAILIFAAGILLASRIYPSLFESSDVTGHDYIKDLELISRELSEKELQEPDTEFLKQRTVRAISLISENLVDTKVIATDTSTRTRLGLILLAAGTFIQSLLLFFQ